MLLAFDLGDERGFKIESFLSVLLECLRFK